MSTAYQSPTEPPKGLITTDFPPLSGNPFPERNISRDNVTHITSGPMCTVSTELIPSSRAQIDRSASHPPQQQQEDEMSLRTSIRRTPARSGSRRAHKVRGGAPAQTVGI